MLTLPLPLPLMLSPPAELFLSRHAHATTLLMRAFELLMPLRHMIRAMIDAIAAMLMPPPMLLLPCAAADAADC